MAGECLSFMVTLVNMVVFNATWGCFGRLALLDESKPESVLQLEYLEDATRVEITCEKRAEVAASGVGSWPAEVSGQIESTRRSSSRRLVQNTFTRP